MTAQVIHLEPHRGTGPKSAEIGPNSVLQTLEALRALEGEAVAAAVRTEAGLPAEIPQRMIPEHWFVQLVDALRHALPRARAEAVLNQSGIRTADYVIENRIPAFARSVLRVLPATVARSLLLRAIRKHAWTFAGRGRMRLLPNAIELSDCPTCRDSDYSLSGGYYASAFERLLTLADSRDRKSVV